MSSQAPEWITTILCPLLGVLICSVLWTTPLKIVLAARADNNLGSINPVPFAVIVFNCIGWTLYSVMTRNYYIFFSNAPGICLGGYFCLTSLQLLTKSNATSKEIALKNTVERILMGSVVFWLIAALVANIILGPNKNDMATELVGILCDIGNVAFYAAPLSVVAEVIKLRDATSLYPPSIAANLVNALLWTFYGFLGINDIFVWLPNMLGGTLAIFQLLLIAVLGRKGADATENGLVNEIGDSTHSTLITGQLAEKLVTDEENKENSL